MLCVVVQCVIVAFPDHKHLFMYSKTLKIRTGFRDIDNQKITFNNNICLGYVKETSP